MKVTKLACTLPVTRSRRAKDTVLNIKLTMLHAGILRTISLTNVQLRYMTITKRNIIVKLDNTIWTIVLCNILHIQQQTQNIFCNKNLAIANRSRVSCINTNNNTMTLKSGLEVTQGH